MLEVSFMKFKFKFCFNALTQELFLCFCGIDGMQVKSPISVSCKSEREVFEKLGFPWLEPHQRNL